MYIYNVYIHGMNILTPGVICMLNLLEIHQR